MKLTPYYSAELLERHLSEEINSITIKFIDSFCAQTVAQFEIYDKAGEFIKYYYIYINNEYVIDGGKRIIAEKFGFTDNLNEVIKFIPEAKRIPQPLLDDRRIEYDEDYLNQNE